MEINADLKNIPHPLPAGKLFVPGIALFCCFVISPLLGSLLLSWKIPFVFIYILVTFFTNILPLIIIAMSFRNIHPATCVIVVFLATGLFREIADIVLSPVPVTLISTPAYHINILVYSILLSIISVGVSLFQERKTLAVGIIVTGMVLYFLFIQKIFFTSFNLLTHG